MSSVNEDEALARALQEEYRKDFEARQQQQRQRRPLPTAPTDNVMRPPVPVASATARPPAPAPVETDEQLARRLEQEMKDAELARRLQEEQNSPSRSRPRSSESTRMSNSRGRRASASHSSPVPSTPSSLRPSSSRPTISSSRRSSLNAPASSSRRASRGSHVNSRRDRPSTSSSGRHASDWTRAHHHGSSSLRASDSPGLMDGGAISPTRNSTAPSFQSAREPSSQRNRSSSRSAHSSHLQSHTRGRGSEIGPFVEPEYCLPPTSVDPPLVNATIVDTSSPHTATMEQYPEPDVEVAMRLAQEERDAALAQQLQRSDQEIASRNATRLAAATSGGPGARRPWTCRRAMGVLIPMALVAGAAAVIVLVVAGRGDLSNIPNIFDDDPFAGTTPGEASRWRNRGDGLQLEVVNALQEQWWEPFNIAMDEWDAGTPDALILSRSSADYDYDCAPIQGKMKVCNGDYGNTRWKGINQILLSGGWIISSVAKLNEYYLGGSSQAQRQYTTCHEIGHGFGLPHTDEDFYNKDLGNCMDYTNNPQVNQSPDDSNYEFLYELYGPAPTRREMNFIQPTDDEDDVLSEDVMELYKNAVHKMAYEGTQHGLVWNLLHKNAHFEFFSTDLGMHNGQNLTVQVHMFLADDG